MSTRTVVYLKDENGEYTGRIRLALENEKPDESTSSGSFIVTGDTLQISSQSISVENNTLFLTKDNAMDIGNQTIKLFGSGELPEIGSYTPIDWRAELYLQGLEAIRDGRRPDMYQQELLDLFDSIYDFREEGGTFKADLVKNPNELKYFLDYLEPASALGDISVDNLNPRVHSYQQDSIKYLYEEDIPNIVLISVGEEDTKRRELILRCEDEGQPYANVDELVYSKIAKNTVGYGAQDSARNLLYQFTHYNENITIQSKPIYYLEPNSRISVYDKASGIAGDYMIKSLSIPLDINGSMNINAIKVIDRI